LKISDFKANREGWLFACVPGMGNSLTVKVRCRLGMVVAFSLGLPISMINIAKHDYSLYNSIHKNNKG